MAGPKPLAIFWQELLPGDIRKIEAQSNDAQTGGGARDLRFPDAPFRPVLERMFPEEGQVRGRPVRHGTLVWEDAKGTSQHQEIEYWPPTSARPGEGRIARIHEIEPLQQPPEAGGDTVLLVLVLDDLKQLRAYYTTSGELRDKWHDDVAQPILVCLGKESKGGVARRGWLDLIDGTSYCHGS